MASFSFKQIPFFQGLTAGDLEMVRQCLKEKSFSKGEILFSEGRGCERVFFVQSGRVKLYRMTSSGREQILEVLGPGETCACNPGISNWFCSSTAEAVTAAKVWFLSRPDYVRLIQTNSQLAHALNRIFAEKLQCLSSLVEEVSLKDVKSRLVKFLLDMLAHEQNQSLKRQALFLPFTREEIAQRLGAARETVARQLYQLKRRKLIEIKPCQIIILDKTGLENLL